VASQPTSTMAAAPSAVSLADNTHPATGSAELSLRSASVLPDAMAAARDASEGRSERGSSDVSVWRLIE
jgi:hypothetical protein